MSLNSFQSNTNSIAITNSNQNTLECYDSSTMEEKTVGCSSLRVRFRMITRKNDHFKARISSSISTSSMFSSTSTSSSSALNTPTNMLLNSPSLATVTNKDLSIGSTSSLSSFTTSKQPQVLEIKQNNKQLNQTVFFYNQQKRNSHSIDRDLIEPKCIPINIGLSKTNESPTSSTTKTFRLTEDLKSNIQFDITLKPSFSIRDDKLDASNSNLRSSSCELSSSCSNFDTFDNETNCNKRVVSIVRNAPHKEQLVNRDQIINNQNKVYHHSSLIRLSINRTNNNKSGANSPRNKSHTNINNSEINENNKVSKRVLSPFTYIETYSRQMSLSPNNNDPKQA